MQGLPYQMSEVLAPDKAGRARPQTQCPLISRNDFLDVRVVSSGFTAMSTMSAILSSRAVLPIETSELFFYSIREY